MSLDSATILANAKALGPMIDAAADQIAADRRLPDHLVTAMRAAGVFRIAFPRAWGGPEMTPQDQCRMIESIAYHDASAAWVAMICSDSGHYAARLDEATARSLYPDLDLLTSGLLMPTGQAVRIEGGFEVTGRWQFGSGCLHADHIVAGCVVMENGTFQMDGTLPKFVVAYLPRAAVEIHDTWYTTGLAGSGSNDYSTNATFVPESHTFHPFRTGDRPEALYRYAGFFFVNLPAVAIGCVQRMVDDLREHASTKMQMPSMTLMRDEYRVQVVLADATARVRAARALQFEVLDDLWATLAEGGAPSQAQRAAVGYMSIYAIQSLREAAENICEVVGASSIYANSTFERRRRDMTTIAAHVISQRKTYTTAAQLLFGVEPATAFI